jgi:Ser/Thr protein kinase RdoA (MazF antagonist)
MDRRERRKIQHNMVLEMYREVSSFSEKQEKVLPLLGAYRDIQFDAWFSARWNDPGFAESYSEDDITSSEYWVDSIEGLEHSIYNS